MPVILYADIENMEVYVDGERVETVVSLYGGNVQCITSFHLLGGIY